MHQIKFYRTEDLPQIGEIGSFYFLHGDINSLYVCINNSGDQNTDYEDYSGHAYWETEDWIGGGGESDTPETPSTPSNLYLPLSGGTMKGTIGFSTPLLLKYDESPLLQYDPDNADIKIGHSESLSSQISLFATTINTPGEIQASAFYETSDARKKDVKSDLSLDKCYDLIDKCQTVIYSLKDQTKEQVGMIAQEIEEFFPEVVATDEEGFKSLAYDRLVVICFKVLKDVIKRLEKLENV